MPVDSVMSQSAEDLLLWWPLAVDGGDADHLKKLQVASWPQHASDSVRTTKVAAPVLYVKHLLTPIP